MTLTIDPNRLAELEAWLRDRLSPHRYRHSLGVADTARRLAEAHGGDAERAALAGLLHDVAREWRAHDLLEAAQRWALPVSYLEEMAPMACLHGPVGSEVVRETLALDDDQVLAAIAHHTMGREGMGQLEKIVFLADAIEPNRPSAPYIDELRELAWDNLDLACRRAYDHTFDYLLRTGQPIHPQACCGRNWLLRQEKERPE